MSAPETVVPAPQPEVPAPVPVPQVEPEPPHNIFHVLTVTSEDPIKYVGFPSLELLVAHLKGLAAQNRDDLVVYVFEGDMLDFTEGHPNHSPYLVLPGVPPIPLFNPPSPGPISKSRVLCMPLREAVSEFNELTERAKKELNVAVAGEKKEQPKPVEDPDEPLAPES
jgi:hypothetical protein